MTPGASASRTPSPRSTPEPRWSMVRLAASVAAPSRPAPAATPPVRTCCSLPDRTGSLPPRWRRWWTSPTRSSPNSASRTGRGPLRARGPRPRRSTGSSAMIEVSDRDEYIRNMAAQGLLDRTGDRIRIGVRMSYWAATALKDLDVLAVVNPVLKEIRDKTGETACFFKVEQNFRVCVAVAETHHALRRDMYVGKVIPLHVGSASRILLAWSPDLAEKVLAGPLESMTDGTVTSPDELRRLITQAKADGYAITAGEREDSASGLSAPVFDAAGDILGAITISGPTVRMPQAQCEAWIDLSVGYAEQVTRTIGGRLPH